MSAPPPPDTDDWTTSRTEEFAGWKVFVLVDSPCLQAVVRLVPGRSYAESPLTADHVRSVVRAAGIIPTDAFGGRVAQALAGDHGPTPLLVPLAEGVPPRPSRDGRLEWHVNREVHDGMRTDGRVDHRERSAIVHVRKGDRLVTVIDPVPGTPGIDVFGRPIPVAPPARPTLRRGAHVAVAADGREFVANADGRLVVDENLVSVENVLTIPGDVDYAVGNINFPGNVVIGQSVLDDFRVLAGGDLAVQDSVGAADLECGGGLTVGGGITGHDRGAVKARGPIRARYLNSAFIQGGADVLIAAEVLNSRVQAQGRVAAGGIVGGEIIARAGVNTVLLGSPMHVPTSVVAGVDFTVEGAARRLREELGRLQREIAAVAANVSPYQEDPQRLAQLPPNRLEQLKETLLRLKEQKARVAEIEGEIERLTGGAHAGGKTPIYVRRMLFPGVLVRIGACRKQFTEEVPGPIRLVPNYEDEGISIEGVHPNDYPQP